ncbi:MAG: rhomboid family intramembrane serine protease [Vulcanimicrobiaceae bacterium]
MTRSRATLTNLLILINVLAFVWEYTTGTFSGTGLQQSEALYAHGGLFGAAVLQNGEWWRLVTSAFLHGGIAHIALNMIALYQIGQFVELLYGRARYALVYVLAMLGSGLLVTFLAPDQVTIGASGAIFGLFGALVAAGLRLGARGRALITQTIPIIVINLVFTFSVPGISWEAHVGGLVTGFLAGLLLYMVPSRQRENAYAYAFQPTADQHRVQTIEQPPVEPPA